MDVNSRALAMAAAGAAGGEVLGVEDVFSTFLYTGNGTTQTITNGIDLEGEGGLVWIKERTRSNTRHSLFDTVRGRGSWLGSDGTESAQTVPVGKAITSFNSNGFSLGPSHFGTENSTGVELASWTFRKAEKFFDVVTYTGNGTANRSISHSLGSLPGSIFVKKLNEETNWSVWHRSLAASAFLQLNGTGAAVNNSVAFGTQGNTDATFGVGAFLNASGDTYVAYLFAHDAGGFGDAGTDSVVSCGSYTGDGTTNSSKVINLGWEAQYVLIKRTSGVGDWWCVDTMRGFVNSGNDGFGGDANLSPNTAGAEAGQVIGGPHATGFYVVNDNVNQSGSNYIYIAIRRGPMKTPTVGTQVFDANASSNDTAAWTTGFPVDMLLNSQRLTAAPYVGTRLTGNNITLRTSSTNAELSFVTSQRFDLTTGTISQQLQGGVTPYVRHSFRRAPGFFDVVAWTASASTSITHGLGVTPELIIAKSRSVAGESWTVYTQPGGRGNVLFLNTSNANVGIADYWGTSGPTSTSFGVAASGSANNAGNMIAYLFASCPGVSKVGNYTGTGTTLDINCGFTAGARFVLIKRTDSTGDWFVWDTARGIISGNDSYLLLNSTAAEVTNTDFIDPLSSGFQISSTAPAAINASGGSFIFLAVA